MLGDQLAEDLVRERDGFAKLVPGERASERAKKQTSVNVGHGRNSQTPQAACGSSEYARGSLTKPSDISCDAFRSVAFDLCAYHPARDSFTKAIPMPADHGRRVLGFTWFGKTTSTVSTFSAITEPCGPRSRGARGSRAAGQHIAKHLL